MQSVAKQFISPEEYLEIERHADFRSEYFEGEMFAMSGGSHEHNLITVNLSTQLNLGLRHKKCTVYSSDMRLHIPGCGLYTYPDVMVVCARPAFLNKSRDSLLNPVLIAEVLSPSTEAYDRGQKFEMYRGIETLREYLLCSQSKPKIERFFKNERGRWELVDVLGWEGSVEVGALDISFALSEIYAKVEGIDPEYPAPGETISA